VASQFAQPPDSSKPWCYWYWISDNLSKDGITRDLEAMARVGIGEALIGNIFLDDVPAGKVKVLSEEWWGLVEHAIREGGRTGVNIGMFNCPGWSQSGGPWIQPGQSMRYLAFSETRVTGPAKLERQLPKPQNDFQDVTVLAFPAPNGDADSLARHSPRWECQPAAEGIDKLGDGRNDTFMAFPAGAGQGQKEFAIRAELPAVFTARSLSLVPAETAWSADCRLEAVDEAGQSRLVESFRFDRSNMGVNVGPLPRGPVTVAFAPVSAKRFRLVFKNVAGPAALAEIDLTPAARVESYVEKQLGKMHPTPQPVWDTYLWPEQPPLDSSALAVDRAQVRNLSSQLTPDGTLRWEVPPGEWVILRLGMVPTGTRNSPASPEGQGLEVDKMNRQAAKLHFNAFIGEVVRRMPASERKAFKHVVADSYEMGSQNWTDGFAKTFRSRYGYDPTPWLPTLTGRVVVSPDQSERFLWDLRRLVADRIALDYVGGLRDLCRPHGLELWLENYGHWGFPAEFLQYGGQSDRIGGEFWVTGDLGSIELRAASSCANTYGKPVVSAEAFTGGPAFQTAPWGLKARGDWAFCEGVNHFVLHVYIHQPWEDKRPGVNAWFGTEFNRHNTWFEAGKAWVDYLRRCSFLLQQGTRVADVAYFMGEDAPKMTGTQTPDLPPGYDFDYLNAEVLLEKLKVQDGQWVLPHGTKYQVLVLPALTTMRPEVLRKLRGLIKAGGIVLGQPPMRSPSLQGYPRADGRVRELSSEIWGDSSSATASDRVYGKGRVVRQGELAPLLKGLGAGPDFRSTAPLRFTHRLQGDTHYYFVANPQAQEVAATAEFRVGGRAPELWWPESGRMEHPAAYQADQTVTRVPLHLGPHSSVFVVFRDRPAQEASVVSVSRNDNLLLDAKPFAAAPSEGAAQKSEPGSFTMAIWVRPTGGTTLLREANQGVNGLSDPRNDVVFPPHGNTFGTGNYAGCGFAVGTNGVVVFEHGANYFAPILVHPVALADWTHVAVVYRDGQPSLYVNGVLAKRGLHSQFKVHPGAAGGPTPFRGQQGTIQIVRRALMDAELAELPRSMPPPHQGGAREPIRLAEDPAGAVRATVWENGTYDIRRVDGSSRTLQVDSVPTPIRLAGPWEVQFRPIAESPAFQQFQALQDWTESREEKIRHFSGTAVYRKKVNLPEWPGGTTGTSVVLSLGKLRDLAIVRVNGQQIGTLWMEPWEIEITPVAKPGENLLEIEVIDSWNNRLVGDANLPVAERTTFLAAPTVTKKSPLLPAGLIGPVQLRFGKTISIPQ
jgi:hypothetical protein